MKKSISIVLFAILSIFLLIVLNSCPQGVQPNFGPKNIVFTPTTGRVGDIITVTGDDFREVEDYQKLYDIMKDLTNDEEKGSRSFVLFNAIVEYYIRDEIRYERPIGTPALEIVSIEKNRIQCKIPEGAKSGKILVLGDWINEDNNPSERNFIVLDASGDEVW